MLKGLTRLRMTFWGAVLAGSLAFGVGQACAAEWQVRMPVQKTARIAPLGDAPQAEKPAAKADAKPTAEKTAPKTALGRAAEAAAVAAAPKSAAVPANSNLSVDKAAKPAPAKKNAKPGPEASRHGLTADPDAAETGPASAASASAASASAKAPVPAPVAKAPKPAPVVAVDPKAKVMPPVSAQARTPLDLPAEGKWVGDVELEYQPDSVVLHVATNSEVERVTWFNLTGPDGLRKLAFDLRGNWRKKGGAVVRCETGPVKVIVMGEHPDRLRLSVEFRSGAVVKELEPVLVRGAKEMRMTIPLAVRLAP